MSSNTQPPTDAASPVEPTTRAEATASPRTAVETDVPEGGPVYRCAYCGRPFTEESYLVLHRGLAHGDVVTADEREAFEAAYAEENASLQRFRIIALGLLVLLYFGFLFVFAVVT
ncbi:DUF7410 domain-containing protein [Salinigranum halophilum]|jgi:hypothetical protein|uniref:DUF7410 domain-containing protein n=1 Tax=Salinigranum halophilum TaxID=2565931 RepID=UPI001F3A81C2|nr:DNA-binding protein [Salinigranum halophilum]